MIQHAQMHGASHVARPEIEIPERANVQSVPARSEQGGSSISVISQDELSPVQCDVSVGLGVSRLFDNIKGEFFWWDKLSHPLPDHNPIAEHALPIRSDEVAVISCLCRIRETQAENPVVDPIWNIRKGQHMRPNLDGCGVDKNLVRDHRTFRRAVEGVGHGKEDEEREDTQLELAVVRLEAKPTNKQSC